MATRKATSILDDVTNMLPQPPTIDETAPRGRLMSKVVQFGEVYLRVYSIGYLATALDRSTATIRRWQRLGSLPPPIIKTQDGARWYLKEEIALYSRLAKQAGLHTGLSMESTGFPQLAARESKKLNTTVTLTVNKKKAGKK